MPDQTIYDAAYRQEGLYWGAKPSAMCARVLEALPPTGEPRPRLLDLGCGEGRNAIYFAQQGYAVTGMDLSLPGLDKLARWAAHERLTVQMVHADIVHYRPEESYDAFFSTGTLHYLPPETRVACFAAYKAHTPVGGIHAISVFVRKPWISPAPDGEPGEHSFRSGELLGYYGDWEILWCTQEIFDCMSGGVPHQHCTDRVLAKKR